LILSVVSACGTREQPIEISTKPVSKPELVLPDADPIIARPVEWIIITQNNYEEVFDQLRREGKSIVLFGLTETGYENLALNLNDIRTHIQQKNAIIVAYQSYYVNSQNVLDNAVIVQ
jgi:hypothetical protein